MNYSYPAAGSPRPHAVSTVGSQSYTYDLNGNLLSGGGRSYGWNADNQPTAITGSDSVQERYTYDAEGERATRTRGSATTVYIGGLEEVDLSNGTVRKLYSFNGAVIAQRTKPTSGASTLTYLHGDHLGSISQTSDEDGLPVGPAQHYTPWGDVRGTDITTTGPDSGGMARGCCITTAAPTTPRSGASSRPIRLCQGRLWAAVAARRR